MKQGHLWATVGALLMDLEDDQLGQLVVVGQEHGWDSLQIFMGKSANRSDDAVFIDSHLQVFVSPFVGWLLAMLEPLVRLWIGLLLYSLDKPCQRLQLHFFI